MDSLITTPNTWQPYRLTRSAHHGRSTGGLGPNLRIPLLADRNMCMAPEYGCLIEDKGITFRPSHLIDPNGVLRQRLASPHMEMRGRLTVLPVS
jgi:alkyl hydroperoxide reductase subunit AhpC